MRVDRELKTTSVAQLFFLAVPRLVVSSFGLKVWLSRTGVSTTIKYTTSKLLLLLSASQPIVTI